MGRNENGVVAGTLLLTAGALLGAGVALLLAPQSGRDTRKEIARYVKKAGRRAEGVVGEFTEVVTGMVDAVGEKAEGILEQGKDLAYDAKKELIGAIEEGQKKLEKQKARIERLIA
jgi:gas vesicle protein